MRSVWRGAISFGLVTIGVRLYTATEEHDFRFHQVHREDGGRIRYKRVCQVCGEEVAFADIAKGYELDDGRLVVMENEDFEKLPVNTDHAIDVLEFVPVEEIDPIYFQKCYYLEPDKAAARPYVLLRTALEQSGQLAVVKITIRQRETLAMLRAREDLLVMHTMLWPDEVRKPEFDFLDGDVEVRPQELRMASSLVESMAGSFDPGDFSDDYTVALQKMIEAKAEGAELPERPESEDSGEVIDLMTALERSVEQARSARGESGGKSGKASPRKSSRSSSSRSSGGKSEKAAPKKKAKPA
ncbi:Ku protein [Actinosynnema sp. NPDC047251]|uniref:Non-homologous end joining protein Ku n=1 Tax=Saccharothrix espanaensis (strain ATCC 51144 / DSM 44229 / JCM 9112 / NBRC 15066 / NRRL 15764) TaxID=1179773 RepID=K0K4Y0_SACES|nr:Ku protein [Saccharothrix espanaensis]CCH31573.1 putative DNA repair protein, Ku family [Saccharothrix espanaensis DSM 44229]